MTTKMKHVNLIERKIFSKQALTLNYFWILVLIVGFVISAFSFSFYQRRKLAGEQARLSEISSEVSKLKETPTETVDSEVDEAAVREITKNPVLWSKLMQELSQKIPPSVELTQATGTILGTRALSIQGHASTLQSVLWMRNELATLTMCTNVQLLSLEQEKGNLEGRFNFKIECRIP